VQPHAAAGASSLLRADPPIIASGYPARSCLDDWPNDYRFNGLVCMETFRGLNQQHDSTGEMRLSDGSLEKGAHGLVDSLARGDLE
jgi:hypothetical protein